MSAIPVHQAIQFVNSEEEQFNNINPCPCDLDEKWFYLVKDGDITQVQILRECTPITYGSDIILNGSFETAGETPVLAANWILSDTEAIERANSDPYIGSWSLRWNVVNTGSATQDTGINFLDGEIYLLEFYVKVVNPIVNYETPLEVYVGGQNYEVTPTEEYTKISIPVVFLDNGIDQDVVFLGITISPQADFMYLDYVTLKKITYSENSCEFNLVYNGGFEYGQHKVTGDTPVAATFDGWELDGTVEASITGGYEGTRCPVLYGAGTPASVGQTLPVMASGNTYQISFFAKATNNGDALEVTAGLTEVETYSLTTEWVEYSIEFTAPNDATELIFVANTDGIYIDNASIVLLNVVNNDSIYIKDIINDIFYTDDIGIDEFEGGYNIIFDWDEIFDEQEVGCFEIITEFAENNLVLNSKFEEGVGDSFTSWTKNTGGTDTIIQNPTGGVNGSRCPVLIKTSGIASGCELFQTVPLVSAQTYTLSFFAKVDNIDTPLYIQYGAFMQVLTLTTFYKRYTYTFTASASNQNLFFYNDTAAIGEISIDNIFLSENGIGVYYSEQFKLVSNEVCAPKITWYDNENCFGINYESGFQNHIRLKDINFQALSYPTEMTKTLNGLESSISFAEIRKQKTLNITPSPELIHDRLAVAIRHSNFEVDTEALCSTDETVYTYVDNETGGRLQPATVILGIEGEILAERSINCE